MEPESGDLRQTESIITDKNLDVAGWGNLDRKVKALCGRNPVLESLHVPIRTRLRRVVLIRDVFSRQSDTGNRAGRAERNLNPRHLPGRGDMQAQCAGVPRGAIAQ